jgi:two-component system, OmpR family, response regulator
MKSNPQMSVAKGKRILIVDDEPQVLEVFSALLEEAGYKVDRAENALAAMAAIVRATPDLILADIRMPVVGGMDLVRELKSHIDSSIIPVVAFTGYDTPQMREEARKAGYDDFLAKPTKDMAAFLDRIAEILGPSGLKQGPKPPAQSVQEMN